MRVSRRGAGWLSGITTAAVVGTIVACGETAGPLKGGPRLDEVPCWNECTQDSIPTFVSSPSLFVIGPCYDQEGDLGTDVVIPQGCPSSFDDGDHPFVVSYTSHVNPDIGLVAVSAQYELTYGDLTHYTARFMHAVLYGHDQRVHDSTTIHLSSSAAGVRVRSFNLVCPSGTTDAYTCWVQGGGAFDHDELHICIANSSTNSWTDSSVYCALNLGDDAPLPLTEVSMSGYTNPPEADAGFFLEATRANRDTSVMRWEVTSASDESCVTTGWSTSSGGNSTIVIAWHTGPTPTWWARLRVTDVDQVGFHKTEVFKLSGPCPVLSSMTQ